MLQRLAHIWIAVGAIAALALAGGILLFERPWTPRQSVVVALAPENAIEPEAESGQTVIVKTLRSRIPSAKAIEPLPLNAPPPPFVAPPTEPMQPTAESSSSDKGDRSQVTLLVPPPAVEPAPAPPAAAPDVQSPAPVDDAGLEILDPASCSDEPADPEDPCTTGSIPHSKFKPLAGTARDRGLQHSSLVVLQFGDSHTAADLFTGEVRRRLQARYGNGGAGYLVAGKPHPGIRSDAMKVTASAGWTYSALQKSPDDGKFFLAGFHASAAKAAQTLTFDAGAPTPYDVVSVEAMLGPDQGAIDIIINDGTPERHVLNAADAKPTSFQIKRSASAPRVHRIVIRTVDERPVVIGGVEVLNLTYGASVSPIGFPGATVNIVNKFEDKLFVAELKAMEPQVVVLAFGTNEGFNDDLELDHYREQYLSVLRKIRSVLPGVKIVMIGPASAGRLPKDCSTTSQAVNCRVDITSSVTASVTAIDTKPVSLPKQNCAWAPPPLLDRVRQVQKQIAREQDIAFWDWSSIMPANCAADKWATAMPKLMAGDRVHFTAAGYRLGASKFAAFLTPIIDRMRVQAHAVPNN